MAINNGTEVVTATRSGTGWTIDVTNANLSTDLTVKDFIIEFDSTVQPNSNFTKSSSTLITYNGSAIGSTLVAVYRDTPVQRIQEVTYADRITSTLWENEFNRMHRILSELGKTIRLDSSPIPSDDSTKAATTAWVRDLVGSPDSIRTIDFIDPGLSEIGKPEDGTIFFVIAAGQTSLNDGNGGIIYWDEDDTTSTVDNINVWQVDGNNANGRWKRISLKQSVVKVSQNLAQAENSDIVPATSWVNNRSADIAKVMNGRLSNHVSDIILSNLDEVNGRYSNNVLYLHRWNGDHIALLNPSSNEWVLFTLPATPISISTAGLYDALKPHDVFAFATGGNVQLQLVKWASQTARDISLTRVDGVLCKDGDTGKRYLGTLLLNGGSQVEVGFNDTSQSNSYNAVYLRNAYNQLPCYCYNRRGQAIFESLTTTGVAANHPNSLSVGFINGIAGQSYNDPLAINVTVEMQERIEIQTMGTGGTVVNAVMRTWDLISNDSFGNVNHSGRSYERFTAAGQETTMMLLENIQARYRAGRNLYGISMQITGNGSTNPTARLYYPATSIKISDLTW